MEKLRYYDNAYRRLWFESSVEVDEDIWFAASNVNGIFRADKKTGEAQFITNFPEYSANAIRLYAACVLVQKKIVFAPCNAREVVIFSLETRKIKIINLKKELLKCREGGLFFSAFEYKGFAWIIGMTYPAILKIDVNTYEVCTITEPFKRYTRNGIYECKMYFRHGFEIYDDKLYLPALCENGLVCMDLSTYKCELIEVLPDNSKAWDLCIAGEYLFTWGINYKLSRFHLKTGENRIFDIENDTENNQSGAFLIPGEKEVLVFPLLSKKVFVFRIEKGNIVKESRYTESLLKEFHVDYSYNCGNALILSKVHWNQKYWLFTSISNEYILVDQEGNIDRICFFAKREWDMASYLTFGGMKENKIIIEKNDRDLINLMLSVLAQGSYNKERSGFIYGKKIYGFLNS